MNTTDKYLAKMEADIVAFCKKQEMGVTSFGRKAVGNCSMMSRLRAGTITILTLKKASQYIEDNSK